MAVASESPSPNQRPSALLIVVRYVVPAVVVIAGIVLMTTDHSSTAAEGAGGVIGAGLAIFAANWFFRIGARGDGERDVEAAARDYYSVNGIWPTEEERKRFGSEGRWREDQDLPEPVAGPVGQ
jgi:hypothetical protein